jgi:ribosome-associated toxin RatA of RatAB toxin-antitoxin module
MTTIHRSALLPYPADKIYHLINDVASYPQFMDGCLATEIISESEAHMEARLDLARAGLKYSFTTRNKLVAPNKITMQLVDGPFSSFSGVWEIKALGEEACKVSLRLDFELKSKVFGIAAKTMSNPLASSLVDAVVKRAQQLYS